MTAPSPAAPSPAAPAAPSPAAPAAPAWADGLLARPAGCYAAAAAHLVVVAWFALTQRYLHDESVFTANQARLLLRAPLALFFFLKSKPVLMVVYALPMAVGFWAFALVHAAVGAAAVVLSAAAARRLGAGAPNVAAWVLAASLSFTIAASNGYPNSDGACLLALFLYLHAGPRRGAAAVVLGLLPFARSELAAVTLVFAAWDVATRRDARFLAAMAAVPLAYALAGAAYHRDLLWLYHRFPNPAALPWDIRVSPPASALDAAHNLRRALLDNAPVLSAFGLLALARPARRLAPLQLSVVAVYGVMTAFQMADWLGFDASPRYYITALPLLAVLAAHGLAAHPREGLTWAGVLGLALACAATDPAADAFAAVVMVACAAQVGLGWRHVARAVLVLGAVGYVVPQLRDDTLRERAQLLGYHRLVAQMRARGLYDHEALFTDTVVALYDARVDVREPHVLINDAILWEGFQSLDPANGQRAALFRALVQIGIVYDVEHAALRRDAVYVLRDAPRTRRWRERLAAAGAVGVALRPWIVYRFPPPAPAR